MKLLREALQRETGPLCKDTKRFCHQPVKDRQIILRAAFKATQNLLQMLLCFLPPGSNEPREGVRFNFLSLLFALQPPNIFREATPKEQMRMESKSIFGSWWGKKTYSRHQDQLPWRKWILLTKSTTALKNPTPRPLLSSNPAHQRLHPQITQKLRVGDLIEVYEIMHRSETPTPGAIGSGWTKGKTILGLGV